MSETNENLTNPVEKESEELRVRSFRLSDTMVEKIKEIGKEEGGNQQAVFEKMMEAYEWCKLRKAMPERADNLDQFEKYTKALMRMYQCALEESASARSIAEKENRKELLGKDELIDELNRKILKMEKEAESWRLEFADMQNKLEQEKENRKRLEEDYKELKKKSDKDRKYAEDKEKLLTQYAERELNHTKKVYEFEEKVKEQREKITLLNETMQSLKSECKDKEDALTRMQTLLDEEEAKRDKLIEQKSKEIQKQMETEKKLMLSNIENKSLRESRVQMEKFNDLQRKYMELALSKTEK